MKKISVLVIAGLSLLVGLAGACSSGSTSSSTGNANRVTANANTANASVPAKSADDTPAAIKAALPEAQDFTAQHKDIPKNAIAEIEEDTGAKVPDTDHHSYLGFSTAGGKRTQIGAATIVKAAGKDVVVVYENKGGSPSIKEVRGEGVAPEFLKQFAGKGHDDMLSVGNDIKATGVDAETAKALAQAIRIDMLTMQNLYGAAHAH